MHAHMLSALASMVEELLGFQCRKTHKQELDARHYLRMCDTERGRLTVRLWLPESTADKVALDVTLHCLKCEERSILHVDNILNRDDLDSILDSVRSICNCLEPWEVGGN